MFSYNIELIPYEQESHSTQHQDSAKTYHNELNFDRLHVPFQPTANFHAPFVDPAGTPTGYHNMIPLPEFVNASIIVALQGLDRLQHNAGGGGTQQFWGGMDWGIRANG